MQDALAGAHHLHIARDSAADIAQMVLVGDGAFPDIGDDFHVAVTVARKAGTRLDRIVIPDQQGAEAVALGMVVVGEAEVVAGRQPFIVEAPQRGEGNDFEHRIGSLSIEPVPVMGSVVIERRPLGHDAGRVDGLVAPVVVPLDVVEVHRLGDAGRSGTGRADSPTGSGNRDAAAGCT